MRICAAMAFLDRVLPPNIPCQAMAELQMACRKSAAVLTVTASGGDGPQNGACAPARLLTYDDRNWELRWAPGTDQLSIRPGPSRWIWKAVPYALRATACGSPLRHHCFASG